MDPDNLTQPDPADAATEARLAGLLSELPDAPPAPAPAASAQPPVAPEQFVPKAQFDELNQKMVQLQSVMPIAEALAKNPQQAEALRHQLIMGDVAVPGSHAATAPAPIYAAPPPQAAPTPEMIEQLRAKMIENPLAFVASVAQAVQQQTLAQHLAPLQAANAQTAVHLFKSGKSVSNAHEYAAVAPYFERALGAVDQRILASADPVQLQSFLDVTYRAARGDAYAEAAIDPAQPGALSLPAAQQTRVSAPAPPYSGAAGAPAAADTNRLQREAQQNPATAQSRQIEAMAAKRAGLTKADMTKYGRDVINELGVVS